MIGKGRAILTQRQPPAHDGDAKTIDELNAIIAAADSLVPGAKHAVLGEGPLNAAIAFVGEQPGDQEDIEGHPFVGRAGQLLTQAMDEAGIDRAKSTSPTRSSTSSTNSAANGASIRSRPPER